MKARKQVARQAWWGRSKKGAMCGGSGRGQGGGRGKGRCTWQAEEEKHGGRGRNGAREGQGRLCNNIRYSEKKVR